MKIAIMGAMDEEISPIINKFQNYSVLEYAGNKYYEITYKGIDIVLVHSKIGKVFSAMTATILIEKFSCDMLLFSGVAGSLNEKLKIGDLLIAKKFCQHDVDITKFGHDYGFIPNSSVFINSTDFIRGIALEIALELNISAKEGVLATGDKFISSNEDKHFIKNTFRADAIDMESASVAVVCNTFKIPFLVIRSISDNADGDSSVDFEIFLKDSAEKSANLLINLIDKIL